MRGGEVDLASLVDVGVCGLEERPAEDDSVVVGIVLGQLDAAVGGAGQVGRDDDFEQGVGLCGAVDVDGQAFDDEVCAVDGAGEDERVVIDVEKAGEGCGFAAE